MAAFRFRLQRLLEIREVGTRERARELGSAQSAEDGAARRLEATSGERSRHLDQLRRDAPAEPLEIDAWEAGRAQYRGLRKAEGAARAPLQRAEAATDAARGAFLQARQEQRALGRLRERRRDEWSADQAAADQAVLDDGAGRRGGGAGPSGA